MKRSAYAKLLGLAVLEIVLLTAFLVPMQVKLDMPSGTSPHAVEAARDWVPLFSITTAAIITISILAIPIWLAVRIVRRERATASIPANFS